ncbi:MAG: hypothetical protein ABWZ98_17260 [Nakamurella sp.]
MDDGLQRAFRITSGVLGLLLSLPLAIAAYGVAVWISSDAGVSSGATAPVLAVTVAVGLVALVLFVCAIRTLVRAFATRLTLYVMAGCEVVALVLFVLAIRAGSNLVLWAVIAGVAAIASVVTGLRSAPRQVGV